MRSSACLSFIVTVLACASWQPARAADGPLAEYFKAETAKLAARPLMGIDSLESWKTRRPELQRHLREMLGLDPLPDRTDLHARVTGIVERPDFVIEKLVYESRPGLYVTGNLYRPKEIKEPLPAILYVCGHSEVKKNGIIYGNKAHYQHHAAWYAANGYVCLVVDTLQLGELPGLHHGTYHEGMYWWWSRGYTPAGVEAWNGIRGIDYLVSRPEVDKTKIGVTGRSGGGATTWWIAAIDDRVTAAVPVAGITDLTDHVVAGVVEGHCDCMYFVNTYRWDFPLVAALVAPKALLVENTDQDPIFPEAGVRRIYAQLEKVYAWYGASDRLGLVIGKGGHVDSAEIRHPSFAFFNTWLKGKPAPVTEPDRKISVEDLRVLAAGEVPANNQNGAVQEWFVPKAKQPRLPESPEAFIAYQKERTGELASRVFAGWPAETERVPIKLNVVFDETKIGIRLRAAEFESQTGVTVRLWILTHPDAPTPVTVGPLDDFSWKTYWSWLADPSKASAFLPPAPDPDHPDILSALLLNEARDVVVVAPRGIGPAAWDPKKDVQVRRRFMLLGQTLESMQAWDLRRAVDAIQTLPDFAKRDIGLAGNRDGALTALWAALHDPDVKSLTLYQPPVAVRQGPAYLNVERFLDVPQAVALLYPRPVSVGLSDAKYWTWDNKLKDVMPSSANWFRVLGEPVR